MLGRLMVGIFLEVFLEADTQLTSSPEDLCLNQQSSYRTQHSTAQHSIGTECSRVEQSK
jgi:hypothetical protein